MAEVPLQLKLVESIEQLRENVRSFSKDVEENKELLKELNLLQKGQCWVYDPDTKKFANAKFAGYSEMNAAKYKQARSRNRSTNFDGRKCSNKIKDILGVKEWLEDKNLSKSLKTFAKSWLNNDVLAKIDHSNWKFVKLPKTVGVVARARSMDRAVASSLEDSDDISGAEGGKRLLAHFQTERNSGLAAAVKRLWRKDDPALDCMVCGFSFSRTYGKLGDGFAEAHHQKPLSARHRKSVSTAEQFDCVCSNCHSMLHRMGDKMETSALREIVERLRQK